MAQTANTSARRRRARGLEIMQVIREGGGTLPVELAVARQLAARGHHVRVAGPPEAGQRVQAAGFAFDPLSAPPTPPGAPPGLLPRLLAATQPWAQEMARRLARARPDVVVTDSMLFGPIIAATSRGVRCAVLIPTVYPAPAAAPAGGAASYAANPQWQAGLASVNRARTAFGQPPVASVTEQLLRADRVLVLSSRAFELPEVQPPPNVVYTGPQLAATGEPDRWESPWKHTSTPLVLVSLSTTDQGQQDLLSRLLAAIATLPAHALVTLGPAVDPARLQPPPNVVLERFVPHAAVLPHAAVVVTHAGHGTVMAALAAGVPVVCMPMGRDQPDVALRVQRHGTGISVPPGTGVAGLRTAIERVLTSPTFRQSAQRMATLISQEGTNRAAGEIETLARSTT
jgi:MGT family glycosyltransferase